MQYIALLVIIISLIAMAYRDLKIALISLLVILLAVVVFYFLSPDQEASGKRHARILSNLELTRSEITRGYAEGFVLKLRILNRNRDTTLEIFTILSRLSDCNPDHSDCLVIGEEKNVLKLRIPPGQARDADINLRIKQLNPIQGSAVWEHKITGAR